MKARLTLCTGCMRTTLSLRENRAKFICKECRHNKTLGDIYQYELKNEKVS